MNYAIHYYDHDKDRVVCKHYIAFSISGAIKDIQTELEVDEADICAVILLES